MRAIIVIPAPIKDSGLSTLVDSYLQRLQQALPTTLVHVKGEKIPPRANPAPYLAKEGTRILQATPNGYTRIALRPEGKVMSSEAFAKHLGELRDRGVRGVAFWVGSAFGLDPALVSKADQRLSLSAMTLPHQLAVTLLAEQLYRAHAILTGSPYHK